MFTLKCCYIIQDCEKLKLPNYSTSQRSLLAVNGHAHLQVLVVRFIQQTINHVITCIVCCSFLFNGQLQIAKCN